MEKAVDVFDIEVLCEDENWDALGRFVKVSRETLSSMSTMTSQDVRSWTLSDDRVDTLEMIADISSRYPLCPSHSEPCQQNESFMLIHSDVVGIRGVARVMLDELQSRYMSIRSFHQGTHAEPAGRQQ